MKRRLPAKSSQESLYLLSQLETHKLISNFLVTQVNKDKVRCWTSGDLIRWNDFDSRVSGFVSLGVGGT